MTFINSTTVLVSWCLHHRYMMAWLSATVLLVVYYETSLDYWYSPTVIGLSAWESQIAHNSSQIAHTVLVENRYLCHIRFVLISPLGISPLSLVNTNSIWHSYLSYNYYLCTA